MATQHTDDLEQVLDVPCYNCNGTGLAVLRVHGKLEDCDVCYGTGYQPTTAGIELLNFIRRQRKRIERERV